jgi:hypothetical protein
LSFLENGKMCGILNFTVFKLDHNLDTSQVYWVATKTQYAGCTIYEKLILLLDYISSTYMVGFECVDEGQFWETRNEKLLEETFARYTHLISGFTDALTIFPKLKQEIVETYCIRITGATHKKR